MKNILLIAALLLARTVGATCTVPTISGVTEIPDSTGTKIAIAWTTSVATDALVYYGVTNPGTFLPVQDTGGVTSHSVTLTGLIPQSPMAIGIVSQAISGGVGCGLGYFAYYGGAGSAGVETSVPPAGTFDYGIYFTDNPSIPGESNPSYVTQGYGIFFFLRLQELVNGSTSGDYAALTLTGLPNFTSIIWTNDLAANRSNSTLTAGGIGNSDVDTVCSGGTCNAVPGDTLTKVETLNYKEIYLVTNVGGTTTPGTYTITATGGCQTGVSPCFIPTHTATFTLHVVAAPFSGTAFPYSTPTLTGVGYPAIPNLSTYLASANTYGLELCAEDLQPTFRTIRPNNNASFSISTLTRTSNVTTATTVGSFPTGSAGFNTSNQVSISGVADSSFDVSSAPMTVTGASTFTYPNSGSNGSSTGGTVQNLLTPVGIGTTYAPWFYDGRQAYYNVENLLNNGSNWEQCRTNIKQVWRNNFIIPNTENIILTFTHGLYTDYSNAGEPADITALVKIITADNPDYSHAGGIGVTGLQREMAYMTRNAMHAVLLGQNTTTGPTATYLRDYGMEHVLGMVDQMCLSGTAQYWENFMTGLQADSLIQYYNLVRPDPRIPPAIKCLADWMWANNWQTIAAPGAAITGTFPYDRPDSLIPGGAGSCQITLNQLIAPMYAWVFSLTGSATYQTEGDAIFGYGALMGTGGTTCGTDPDANLSFTTLNGGKQWSQQYYLGYDYVLWRSAPPVSTVPASGVSF